MQERTLWWLKPAWIVGGFSGFVTIAAYLLPETAYLTNWRTPKFVDGELTALMLALLACFVASSLVVGIRPKGGLSSKVQPEPQLSQRLLTRLFLISYCLTLFGYLVWASLAVARGLNGSVILGLLRGQNGLAYVIRHDYLANVPGVTTCTQFGVAAVILGALSNATLKRRRLMLLVAPMLTLTILRVLLNDERLALTELLVPLTVLMVHKLSRSAVQGWTRSFLSALPVAGFGALFVFFSVFEYFRSWVNFYSNGNQTFIEFAASRLLGYYVTAANNGACLLQSVPSPMQAPLITMEFAFRAPILGNLMRELFPNTISGSMYFGLLARVANPEYNNNGGILPPVFEWGVSAGFLYWLLAGVACGLLHRWFRAGNAWGLCLYPFVFITLVEIPRGLYWSDSRAFPPLCFLLVSAFLLRMEQERTSAVAVRPPLSREATHGGHGFGVAHSVTE